MKTFFVLGAWCLVLGLALAGCYSPETDRIVYVLPPVIKPAVPMLPMPKVPAFHFAPKLRPEDRTLFTPDGTPIYPNPMARGDKEPRTKHEERRTASATIITHLEGQP